MCRHVRRYLLHMQTAASDKNLLKLYKREESKTGDRKQPLNLDLSEARGDFFI